MMNGGQVTIGINSHLPTKFKFSKQGKGGCVRRSSSITKILFSRFTNRSNSKTNEPITNEAPSNGLALGRRDSSSSTTNDYPDAKEGMGENWDW